MTGWPHGSGEMAERIRTFDWSSTPLGPSAHWPQSLKTTIDLMIGSPQFTILVWGSALTMFYNDTGAFFLGKRHPALGRSFPEIWQGQGIEAMIAATLGGRPIHYTDQYFETPSRPGHPFGWFTGSWTPLRDESGGVVGVYITGFETTERVLAERALHGRETQQAFLLKLSDGLRPLDDPGSILGEACRLLGDHLGADHTYFLEIRESDGVSVVEQDHVRGALPSFVGTHALSVLPSLVPLYRTGRPVVVADTTSAELIPECERAILAAAGRGAWIAIPLVKRGELVGALTVVQTRPRAWSEAEIALVAETGERIWAAIECSRAERQAREAEARLRTMADTAPVLIWDTDPTGNVYVNEFYLVFFGTTLESVVKDGWERFVHPDDREGYAAAYRDAFARRRALLYEARVIRADGQPRWMTHSGRPLGKDRFVGISIDITERREAEESLTRNNRVLRGINRIFSATLGAASVEELAHIALDVAADLTESPAGLIATLDAHTDRLTTLATVDRAEPGEAAALERAVRREHDPAMRGLEPGVGSAPDAILSVPLAEGETVVGVIGLAGRPGGYRPEDREAAEALAPAIRHALLSKRGDLRLRESEARFRQFAQASSDVLWITDAETFASEFVSPALRAIYGMSETEVLGDARLWAAHIVPEDRARTFAEMERVRGGEAVVYEFRILRPSDGSFRCIRNHGFPLFDEDGRVRRIGGITSDVTEMRQAEHHQRVLLAELQHRVRNIMALIRSIVMRSGERAESVAAYADLVGARLVTLARVQSRLTRAADAGVAIAAILRDELGAQAENDDQYDLAGPAIELAPKAAEVLTLAVHELTTNAIKHGALSNRRGRVSVRWRRTDRRDGPWLSFLWIECGGPAPAPDAQSRRGFGSELIEGMIPYELSGRGRIELTPGGARCLLDFPLTAGASILETQAPQLSTVFGGSLDLRGQADLGGQRILVAEDEFYLAGDTARAFEAVGATVLGPYAGEAAALDGLGHAAPTGAVVDIDLGGRVSFALPRALAARGVPFAFVTGHEALALPPDLAEVPRLVKPVELRRVVATLAQLIGVASARALSDEVDTGSSKEGAAKQEPEDVIRPNAVGHGFRASS
ncbi:PAS domain S-box protein [Methylobacterium sp. Leaf456]|uniref:PAS domain S-box protein n=1 Tax=Methylobacterium sp. Leaf456 TaxID=1736382 RepID=UPI000A5559C0|nr:PAS domain S-box protein [Methylobacterium sp. Leaf456]